MDGELGELVMDGGAGRQADDVFGGVLTRCGRMWKELLPYIRLV
jgi:hypothetical protein